MGLLAQNYDPNASFFDNQGSDPGGGGDGGAPGAPPPTTPGLPPLTGTGTFPGPTGGGNGHGGPPVDYSYLSGKPQFDFGPTPVFNPTPFTAPDAASLLKDPGYQARLNAGSDALERSAASRGVLRTGGTLKDIIDYNQNFASNEYSNDFNRAAQTYQLNYTGQHDAFAPQLAAYQLKGQAETAAVLAQYARQFDLYKYLNPNYGPQQAPIAPPPVYIPPYGG